MILDKNLQLASAQDITDADAYTTNTVDLGAPTVKRRIGTGTPLSLVFIVTTAAAGDSASATDTCDFMAVDSPNANLSSHTALCTRRVPAASLVAGAIVEVPLPVGTPTQQYLGGRVELGTGDTVSVDCYVVPRDHVPDFIAYAKGYAI